MRNISRRGALRIAAGSSFAAILSACGGATATARYGITGGYFWAYSGSKYHNITGDMFHYLGTEEGQATFVRISGGAEPATFPKANQVSGIDPRVTKALSLFDQQLRRAPNPSVRNPEVELLNLERKTNVSRDDFVFSNWDPTRDYIDEDYSTLR